MLSLADLLLELLPRPRGWRGWLALAALAVCVATILALLRRAG